MNLIKAKQLLKEHGYKLIKENTEAQQYICYGIYGDRAHSDPETANIYAVTSDKNVLIDNIVDWFNMGPSDIFFCGVIPVDDDTADEFAAMGNDDIADTPNCAKLMDLIKDGNNLEYSCDSMLEYYDPDDEEGSIAAIRNMVTDDIMAL